MQTPRCRCLIPSLLSSSFLIGASVPFTLKSRAGATSSSPICCVLRNHLFQHNIKIRASLYEAQLSRRQLFLKVRRGRSLVTPGALVSGTRLLENITVCVSDDRTGRQRVLQFPEVRKYRLVYTSFTPKMAMRWKLHTRWTVVHPLSP